MATQLEAMTVIRRPLQPGSRAHRPSSSLSTTHRRAYSTSLKVHTDEGIMKGKLKARWKRAATRSGLGLACVVRCRGVAPWINKRAHGVFAPDFHPAQLSLSRHLCHTSWLASEPGYLMAGTKRAAAQCDIDLTLTDEDEPKPTARRPRQLKRGGDPSIIDLTNSPRKPKATSSSSSLQLPEGFCCTALFHRLLARSLIIALDSR